MLLWQYLSFRFHSSVICEICNKKTEAFLLFLCIHYIVFLIRVLYDLSYLPVLFCVLTAFSFDFFLSSFHIVFAG
jgi:hypothetical protein